MQVEVKKDYFVRKVDGILQIFFPEDVALVKNIKRKNLSKPFGQKWIYHPKASCWECPNTKANIKRLQNYGFDLSAVGFSIEKKEVTWKTSETKAPEVIGHNGLSPWDFQKEVLKFLAWRKENFNGSGLLALDMALGKSVIACLWSKHLKHTEGCKTLIVCPATLKDQWYNYNREWVNSPTNILSGRKGENLDPSRDYIINYDVLSYTEYVTTKVKRRDGSVGAKTKKEISKNSWFKFLKKNRFDLVIVDESQLCNNPASNRGKALREICESSGSVIFLSGTPIKTKPSQYWLSLNAIDKGLFPSLEGFKKMYSIQRDSGYGYNEVASCKNHTNLTAKLIDIMVRYKKEDVLKDLPDKNRIIVPIDLDKEVYNEGVDTFSHSLLDIGVESNKKLELKQALNELSRSVFDAKKEYIVNWLDEWLKIHEGKKIMIFGWHRVVIEYLHEQYKDISVSYYGGTSSKNKILAKEKFIKDPECRMFIANAQSGGTGLDGFQVVCDTCAFVEGTQSPADSDQAEDRLLRPKQKNSVTCYYLPAKDSVDIDIMEIWDNKREMIDKLVEGKEQSESQDLLMRLYRKFSNKQKGLLRGK